MLKTNIWFVLFYASSFFFSTLFLVVLFYLILFVLAIIGVRFFVMNIAVLPQQDVEASREALAWSREEFTVGARI